MQIFAWEVDLKGTVLAPERDEDYQLLGPYRDITALKEPLRLKRVLRPGESATTPLEDFPYTLMPHPRILSERAAAALVRFLEPNGTITQVEIDHAGQRFFAFSPRRVLDVLDLSRSKVEESMRFSTLVQAAFVPYPFEPTDVFVVRGFEDGLLFVTDEFVREVRAAGLKGARFEPQIEDATPRKRMH